MKTTIFSFLLLAAMAFPTRVSAKDDPTDDSGILIPDPPIKNPDGLPESPVRIVVYYTVSDSAITLYTIDSVIGYVKVIDTVTGAIVNESFTELGSGYSVPTSTGHPLFIQVTVDGLSFSATI